MAHSAKASLWIFAFTTMILWIYLGARCLWIVDRDAELISQIRQDNNDPLGDLEDLPDALRGTYSADGDFKRMNAPRLGEWLATHKESGQSFRSYQWSKPLRPDKRRKIIYLQPFDDFPEDFDGLLEDLRRYCSAYFQLETVLLDPLDGDALKARSRRNSHTHNRQLHADDLLERLEDKLPADGFCIIGVTMTDLYPDESWNFVFGMASLVDRVGVYSFARYDLELYHEFDLDDEASWLENRLKKIGFSDDGAD